MALPGSFGTPQAAERPEGEAQDQTGDDRESGQGQLGATGDEPAATDTRPADAGAA